MQLLSNRKRVNQLNEHSMSIVVNVYKKQLSNVNHLICDNENLNKAVARLLNVPMIGCASHRLNLGVKHCILSPYDDILDSVQKIMLKLSNVKKSAELRRKTTLRPIIRNVTRWSSTYEMVTRYTELKPFLDTNDIDMIPLLLSPAQEQKLNKLIQCLKDFESVQKFARKFEYDESKNSFKLLDFEIWK